MRRDPQHDWHWFGLAYAVIFIGLSVVYLAGCATAPEPAVLDTLYCVPAIDGPPICTPSRETLST